MDPATARYGAEVGRSCMSWSMAPGMAWMLGTMSGGRSGVEGQCHF